MTDTPPVDAPDPRIHTDEFREKVAALRRPLTPPVDAQPVERMAAELHRLQLGCVSRYGTDETARAAYDKPAHLKQAGLLLDAARAGDGLLREALILARRQISNCAGLDPMRGAVIRQIDAALHATAAEPRKPNAEST